MTSATVTSKGQITIPARVREAMHVSTGDRVEFIEVAPGRYEFIAAIRSVTDSSDDAKGSQLVVLA